MTAEARKAMSRTAEWQAPFLLSASLPWMLTGTCAGLQMAETMGQAWAGFLGERVRCWGALRQDLGRCTSVEDALNVQSAYLTDMGRAYVDAMGNMSAAAGKAFTEDAAEAATPLMRQARAA
jgi:hypothetical protein